MGESQGTEVKTDEFMSSYAQPPQPSSNNSDEKIRSRQEEDLCEKIQLADGTTYILWWFEGQDPSIESEPHNFEHFVGEEANIANDHVEHA